MPAIHAACTDVHKCACVLYLPTVQAAADVNTSWHTTTGVRVPSLDTSNCIYLILAHVHAPKLAAANTHAAQTQLCHIHTKGLSATSAPHQHQPHLPAVSATSAPAVLASCLRL
jgi:hypothetical protein